MNILTFDIEEWYLEKVFYGGHSERYAQFDRYLECILNLLDERNFKATFFCVGGMASDFPYVVRKIDARGHEVGCHSFRHTWLNKMNRNDALADTRDAVSALEQCIGKKILSYRAPAFSIGKSNKWAFEILAECGILRDASIFPAERDFGGFPDFKHKEPTVIHYNLSNIKEFPICTTMLLGKELAYSGGGYFRFFPLNFVRQKMANSDYAMTYFHIGDFIPNSHGMMSKADYEDYFKEPGTLKNRTIRYIKSSLGKKSAFQKMNNLIHSIDFISIEQADKMIDWAKTSSVVL